MAKVKIMKDGHHLSRDELSVNIVEIGRAHV